MGDKGAVDIVDLLNSMKGVKEAYLGFSMSRITARYFHYLLDSLAGVKGLDSLELDLSGNDLPN